eukprot:gene8241-5762_t
MMKKVINGMIQSPLTGGKRRRNESCFIVVKEYVHPLSSVRVKYSAVHMILATYCLCCYYLSVVSPSFFFFTYATWDLRIYEFTNNSHRFKSHSKKLSVVFCATHIRMAARGSVSSKTSLSSITSSETVHRLPGSAAARSFRQICGQRESPPPQSPCAKLAPPISLIYYLQGATAPVILEAFKRDCEKRNILWEEEDGQRFANDTFLRHPLAIKYPPNRRVLQSFLKLYIASIEQQVAVRVTSGDERAGEMGDPILADLLSAHIDMFISADRESAPLCYKSFLNMYAPVPVGSTSTGPATRPGTASSLLGAHSLSQVAPQQNGEAGQIERHPIATPPGVPNGHQQFCWNTVRVASDMFRNVGLSLWPAAFALVQILAQEFCGESSLVPVIEAASSQNLRVVELGAGVGLTPCVLDVLPGFRSKVHRFSATDYQIELVENMRTNFWLNGLKVDSGLPDDKKLTTLQRQEYLRSSVDGYAAKAVTCGLDDSPGSCDELLPPAASQDRPATSNCGAETTQGPTVSYSLQLLDWTELGACESFFSTHGSDLILAADCIYDVSVVPALVSVIHAGLHATSLEDALREESIVRQRLRSTAAGSIASRAALVVQTHRQDSTIKTFFDALQEHNLLATSYRLVQLPLSEARQLLKSKEMAELYTPLGPWATDAPLQHCIMEENPMVCLLRKDTVRPDGRFQSLVGKEESATELMRDGFIGSLMLVLGVVNVESWHTRVNRMGPDSLEGLHTATSLSSLDLCVFIGLQLIDLHLVQIFYL